MINESKGLKVEVGPHWTISSIRGGGIPNKEISWPGGHSAWYGPWLERFRNGRLFLGFVADPDDYNRADIFRSLQLYSEDNGDTWWVDSFHSHHHGVFPLETKDGMIYLFGSRCGKDYHYSFRQRDSFLAPRYLSYDSGRTWEGPETVYLHIPEARGAVFNGRHILELSDGKLIGAIHVGFGNIGTPAFEEKSRVIIINSQDKGRHWEYLSTVAYDPDIDTEGFTEPVLLQLPSGELLCVMRTDGYHPMMQSFSSDLGRSWSPPVKTGVDGVWPDLCLMQSGIVACAYGRPGCNIMFSLDGTGREWSHHTVIIPPFEPKKQGTWSHSYNAVREIRPGELLYIYNIAGHPEDWHGGALPTGEELLKTGLPTLNSIKATIIKVQRKTEK